MIMFKVDKICIEIIGDVGRLACVTLENEHTYVNLVDIVGWSTLKKRIG